MGSIVELMTGGATVDGPMELSLVLGRILGIEGDPVARKGPILAGVLDRGVVLREACNIGPVGRVLETVKLFTLSVSRGHVWGEWMESEPSRWC